MGKKNKKIAVEGHSGGRMYFMTLKDILGEAKTVLKFRYYTCEKGESSKEKESQLLIDYVKNFGEIPPLNNQSAVSTLILSKEN